jgi:hypothetical protein
MDFYIQERFCTPDQSFNNHSDSPYTGTYHSVDKDTGMSYAMGCTLSKQTPSLFFACCSPLDKAWFPCIDVDGVGAEDLFKALYKNKNKNCIVIKSSGVSDTVMNANSFWIVFDRPYKKFEDAHKFITNGLNVFLFSLCDMKYVQCAEKTKKFVLRAVPKNCVISEIVKVVCDDDDLSLDMKQWIEEFNSHWSSPEIENIIVQQFNRTL